MACWDLNWVLCRSLVLGGREGQQRLAMRFGTKSPPRNSYAAGKDDLAMDEVDRVERQLEIHAELQRLARNVRVYVESAMQFAAAERQWAELAKLEKVREALMASGLADDDS
jgi:hypothetical protein